MRRLTLIAVLALVTGLAPVGGASGVLPGRIDLGGPDPGLPPLAAAVGPAAGLLPGAPTVTEDGFEVSLYANTPGPVTGMAWGPDGLLYVTVIDVVELTAAVTGDPPPVNVAGGGVYRLRPAADGLAAPEPVVLGGRVPLGLTFGPDGTLYYTDIVHGALFSDSWGAVFAVDFDESGTPSGRRTVLQDLPNGIHQTNQVVFGPDGLLYVTNGSSTDSGWHDELSEPAPGLPVALAQPPERFPITAAVLRFDPEDAKDAPLSAFRYRGNNSDIEDPLDVVAVGMRNNFGMVWRGDDLYVSLNGPNPMHGEQNEIGEDLLLLVDDAVNRSLADGNMLDFGWPGCLYTRDENAFPVGATPDRWLSWFKTCDDPSVTPPVALMGPHASANGMAFGPESFGDLEGDLFVTLFSRGAQVARVELTPDGGVDVRDGRPAISPFLQIGGSIDVVVHEGSMYVAQFANASLFGYGSVWKVTPEGS